MSGPAGVSSAGSHKKASGSQSRERRCQTSLQPPEHAQSLLEDSSSWLITTSLLLLTCLVEFSFSMNDISNKLGLHSLTSKNLVSISHMVIP